LSSKKSIKGEVFIEKFTKGVHVIGGDEDLYEHIVNNECDKIENTRMSQLARYINNIGVYKVKVEVYFKKNKVETIVKGIDYLGDVDI